MDQGGLRSKFILWSLTAWVLVKWHNILVDNNYERMKRLPAACKILVAVLQPRSWDLPLSKLGPYTTPPVPAANPFLRKHAGSQALGGRAWLKAQPTAVPARRLILHLLDARREAISALAVYRHWGKEEKMLIDLGATFPAV
ncbi:hypothetical protein FB45DRAFT_887545 [Roridomyces roridus]|uniref:Uncharacterized protein n=1 Tax=Roridomyces roridus TaxID=1738132 RepID=A0AAD7FYG3_9AGAR|nr:hypothetical protein FB45DRAFT_887545 [Roridomyces roridus]